MAKISVIINGQQVIIDNPCTILDACKKNDIYIPGLCNYRGLTPLPNVIPDMACQLCLVEADGKIVLACNTALCDGMHIETRTSAVMQTLRRNLYEIMRRYPVQQLPQSELKEALEYAGIKQLPESADKRLPIRDDNPFFIRDNNKCIMCTRCLRVCEDVRFAGVIEPAYPCYRACPAGIDIPRYIRLIAKGRPEAALAVIREKVPFPGVLGRVCVHPCEGVCQRGLEIDKPLGIRILKRYAADNGGDAWKSQVKQQSSTGKKVAVIGSGPAGLTVAYYLNRSGHTVTVFEALSAVGGMMRVGIPSYRLPREVLSAEIDEIANAGVDIKLNTMIDSPQALFKQGFDAVFVGVGAHHGIKLGIEGGDSQGVLDAAEFLRRVNLGERISVGKRVGIIGGGNVALDTARTSLRLGAKQVTIFYRRTRMEMPANPEEIEVAIDEGIEIIYLATPFRVVRENDVLKLECQRVKLGKPDASGRRHPVLVQGRNFITELDTIVSAIGQRPSVPESFDIKTEKGNTVAISEKMMSSVP
ncbi:MAG TPA: FAD-dependent oxidoreductase, partial [Dehalococcoidales bacterium]|nr:FAD-dependent oxidoreductase [Dehalococcoidales bacterium]